MTHPLLEIHFEDTRGRFRAITKNWYHAPRTGDWIELNTYPEDAEEPMQGRVIDVTWHSGTDGEFVLVRVK